MMFNIVKFFLL